MPSEKTVSRGMTGFEYRKKSMGGLPDRFIIQQLAAMSNVLVPTLDASQTGGGITKLCRKSGVGILRFAIFPVEKANDYSLLELHEKWLNSNRT
jgi:hypothetical protein